MSTLEAGRELDALVAEKVVGIPAADIAQHDGNEIIVFPPYRSDIAAAMGAMECWQGDFNIRRQNGSWRVTLFQPSMQYEEWADALPLAICRALLAAVKLSP